MMVCTAGHVDHGKTQLVKMLTGCQTDRLRDELERGLTIELGFAPCFLGNGLCVGIVDVPGHEKFVRNMVAGVSGIEMAILVVAADDGIMPQTVEHVQIMELLGVRDGIVVLTKTDLVSAETVEQRTHEVREFLTGTFLESAPVCPVSSETFVGYPEFYALLVSRISHHRLRRDTRVFRMPVERTFTRPGFGLVVTGIPVTGSIRIGDQVEVVPGQLRGHVRGLQTFLHDANEGEAGQCLALNVPEYAKTPPTRGQVLCLPGYLRPASFFHVRLQAVPGLDRPLRNAEQVKFHAGTAEEPAKLYLLEETELPPGQSMLGTVAVANPVAAAVTDRFIIRRMSPQLTVAGGGNPGGLILRPTPEEARRPRTTAGL